MLTVAMKATTQLILILVLGSLILGACNIKPDSNSQRMLEGARLFEANCQHCHRYAEDLKEPLSFLEKTIHFGGEKMPSFDGVLTLEEEKLISEYLSYY